MVDWDAFHARFRAPGFIPGFEILHRLGVGAFGEVYKARRVSIEKPYAIKFLKLGTDVDHEGVARELEQVRLFARIDHPNLVSIEDMGVVLGVPFLVMSYGGEDTLARRIRAGDLDQSAAMRRFVQCCRGVLALHDRRLCHFDLKPGNVFLKGEVARVGDYGLAQLVLDGRTRAGARGTPHYMAPEMMRGSADLRADVYSLGVMLYESLCGRLPFGEGSGALSASRGAPPFPQGFPPDLAELVTRCLAWRADERPASVHALLDEMGQAARPGDSVRIRWSESREGVSFGPDQEALVLEEPSSDHNVLEWATLEDGSSVALLPRSDSSLQPAPAPAAPAAGADSGVVSSRRAGVLRALADERRVREARAEEPRVQHTVPVPPRVEGGPLSTFSATLTLGAEVMATMIFGPTRSLGGALSQLFAVGSDREGSAATPAGRLPFLLLALVLAGAMVSLALAAVELWMSG